MKQTFAAKTFASKTFASGNWTGIGIDIIVGYPPGKVVIAYVYVPGSVNTVVYTAGAVAAEVLT